MTKYLKWHEIAAAGAFLLFIALVYGDFYAQPPEGPQPAVETEQGGERVIETTDKNETSNQTETADRDEPREHDELPSGGPMEMEVVDETTIVPTPPSEPEPVSLASFAGVNTQTRAAVVNILCSTSAASGVAPITGSGVIVDEHGVILTNAHIAQYFLLENYPTAGAVQCRIRTGSPARVAYHARLLYLPAAWVEENAAVIADAEPLGTGEHDFAFLVITESATGRSLPERFPAVSLAGAGLLLEDDDPVLIASYPASLLGGVSVLNNLYLSSAESTIQRRLTFSETTQTVDVISTGGSVTAQQGSSGGAVVNPTGALIGIAVTATHADTTGERDLRAITVGHIARSVQEFLSLDIPTLFEGNLPLKTDIFEGTSAPTLRTLLIAEIEN